MSWPLALFVAGALGAQASELSLHTTRRPQELRLWQLPQTGLEALQQHSDPLSSPPSPALAGYRPSATRLADKPRPVGSRIVPTKAKPRLEVGARTPELHGRWHVLLTEAEREGLKPDLLGHIEAEAGWLERAADADLLQRLGWVFLNADLPDQAGRWFALSLARDPDLAAARQGLAQSLLRRGELAQAHALLERLPAASQERLALADALAAQARLRGDDTGERLWLERALADAGDEKVALRERLAWNAQRREAWGEAVPLWRSLLSIEDRPQWREALAAALQAQGDLPAAYQVLDGLPTATTWRAALAGELAGQARAEARLDAERTWLLAAQQADPSDPDISIRLAINAGERGQWDEAADHWARAYALKPDAALAEAWAGSLLRAGRGAELDRLAAADRGPLSDWWQTWQARRLLDQGRARAAARLSPPGALPEVAGVLAPRVGVSVAARDKAGSRGGSRLRLRLTPQLRYAGPYAGGWLEAEAGGVQADAGPAAPTLPYASVAPGQATAPTRVESPVALQLRWSSHVASGAEVRLGTTPIDGPVPPTVTLALAWREEGDGYARRAELYREPVRDSVLSLLGQRDPTSGASWGRVLRNGVRFEGYRLLNDGPWSMAGALRLESLQGRSVADNHHLAAQFELMRHFKASGFSLLQAGPVLGWFGYQRDLSAFTWGHGGYFSPRDFKHVGGALQFELAKPESWRLAGRLSAQWQQFRRVSAPCHPLPPPVQTTTCDGSYSGERNQGLGTEVALRAVARLAPQWQLAASAGIRRGPAYRDDALGLALLYLFEPQTRVHSEDLPANVGSFLW